MLLYFTKLCIPTFFIGGLYLTEGCSILLV